MTTKYCLEVTFIKKSRVLKPRWILPSQKLVPNKSKVAVLQVYKLHLAFGGENMQNTSMQKWRVNLSEETYLDNHNLI